MARACGPGALERKFDWADESQEDWQLLCHVTSTHVQLPASASVLMEHGQMTQAHQLQVGDRVFAYDHQSETLTRAKVSVCDGAACFLEGSDLAVFVSGQHSWCRQLLPVALLQRLPKRGEQLLNVGSQWHGCEGHSCTPCTWNLTRGCRDGLLCGYCHCEHPQMTRSAMRKQSLRSKQASSICSLDSFMDETARHVLRELSAVQDASKTHTALVESEPSTCDGRSTDSSTTGSRTQDSLPVVSGGALWSERNFRDVCCALGLQCQVLGTFVHFVEPASKPARRSKSQPPRPM